MELLEELRWRGLLQDLTPGVEELLKREKVKGYIGFDPTADSLHIGNLVPVTLLTHLQKFGHHPVVLMGGATGMIGDPSGKTEERKLLSTEEIKRNLEGQKKQLSKFLDFDHAPNKAVLVNNADWFKDIGFLEFLRDVGKHITINYMIAKDSVKSRMDSGLSFAEFSYQLVQGFDFYWLFKNHNVTLQMGGSDQWGNMLTGTELIRRKEGKEAHALTAPLITKSDGSKFGKSEGGNIWLDPTKTSPYKFYQFWLNIADEDGVRFLKIFSFKTKAEIDNIIEQHLKEPHLRILQHELSEEMTSRIHSKKELEQAIAASNILFGQSVKQDLLKLTDDQFEDIFTDVPQFDLALSELNKGIEIVDLIAEKTSIMASKGEARRMLSSNSISLNKDKVNEGRLVNIEDLINGKFLLIQRGKKNYFLINCSK